jgi:hypothetical protein
MISADNHAAWNTFDAFRVDCLLDVTVNSDKGLPTPTRAVLTKWSDPSPCARTVYVERSPCWFCGCIPYDEMGGLGSHETPDFLQGHYHLEKI